MKKEYLEETRLLNYNSKQIQTLITERKWLKLSEFHKIKSIYEFVQNEVLFGYNSSDFLNAIEVLNDGYGQCNTKSTLLMALLRAVNIPCRLHGFDVLNDFQIGAIPKLIHFFTPKYILHTWVEVFYQGNWIVLEGVITDVNYLRAVQNMFKSHKGTFRKYAIAAKDLKDICIDWNGKDTFIQKEAIEHDYGIFSSPDIFFATHTQDISKMKSYIYSHIGRKIMTNNIIRIRNTYIQ